jgi:hypothetical protein
VPAFEGVEPDGVDDLPDGDKYRPPDGGDEAMGVTTDNQTRRPGEENGVKQSTVETRHTNPQATNDKYEEATRSGQQVKLPCQCRKAGSSKEENGSLG